MRELADWYPDPYMELIKKTTILFEPELYQQLASLAHDRQSSVGELVRSACRSQYGLATTRARIAAVAEMAAMSLPTGSVEEIKRQSMPPVGPLP